MYKKGPLDIYIPPLRNETQWHQTFLSLSYRRLRGDLIEVFKIFDRLYDVDLKLLMIVSQTRLRINGLKSVQIRSNTNIRRSTFSRRIPDRWNSHPSQVVRTPTWLASRLGWVGLRPTNLEPIGLKSTAQQMTLNEP